ncbi:MAG: adenine deaminase [Oscillospiraceae bacterium]|nr:adenine deaminase [Oscillospiraceae bacterium]
MERSGFLQDLAILQRVARGEEKADLVLKNGYVINVFTEEILKADVAIVDDLIVGVGDYEGKKEIDCTGKYIAPGFIDVHMHIESTMVMPLELSKALLKRGTTSIIADPHEIVNVKGKKAMRFLLDSIKGAPMNFLIMVPSSVPCTGFDTNGSGPFLAGDMEEFVGAPNVLGLGELMCFHDVINSEPNALAKLQLFKKDLRDGHAPGITGKEIQSYRLAGVNNDHECVDFAEVREKMRAGFNIYIREGSAARNLESIVKGILEHHIPFEQCAFCTDDKHLEDIDHEGHIDHCVRKAIALGVPPIKAIKMASLFPARMCRLRKLGAVGARFKADIVVLDSLEQVNPLFVIKSGHLITDDYLNSVHYTVTDKELLNTVQYGELTPERLALPRREKNHVISLVKDQLLTEHLLESIPGNEMFIPDAVYSKVAVLERHGKNGNVAVAPLKGFGIKNGAVGSSVSHDSHNVVIAGDNDADIILAARRIRELGGGYVVTSGGEVKAELPLPIAGLMSDQPKDVVEACVHRILDAAAALGVSEDIDPMITLSFVALPVIPSIRLLDTGLFDVEKFDMIRD